MAITPTSTELDVYYQQRYLEAASLADPDAELRVFRLGQAMAPLMVRPLPADVGKGFDAVSPYDFCGPFLGGASAEDTWEALRSWAREQSIVAAFLRFHPFVGEVGRWRGLDGLHVIHSADNVVVDLDDEDEMFAGFKPRVVRDLKVAHRAGVVCELEPLTPDNLNQFVPLYEETMQRRNAARYYFFSHPFFQALAENLGDAFLLATARLEGRTVGAALIMQSGATAYYYLAASNDEARRVCAMNGLVVEAACRLAEMNVERFHLGGGTGGVSAFKERFGPGRVPYYVGRAVFDSERYAELAGDRVTDFFPAYRAVLQP